MYDGNGEMLTKANKCININDTKNGPSTLWFTYPGKGAHLFNTTSNRLLKARKRYGGGTGI